MSFNKVLTLCSKCKGEMTAWAKYEDRNKKYTCDKCKGLKTITNEHSEDLTTNK